MEIFIFYKIWHIQNQWKYSFSTKSGIISSKRSNIHTYCDNGNQVEKAIFGQKK
ncbi:hypothetical protein LguiA_007087 [Lonicera macranthoides]